MNITAEADMLLQMGANIKETASLCTMVHMGKVSCKAQASKHPRCFPYVSGLQNMGNVNDHHPQQRF